MGIKLPAAAAAPLCQQVAKLALLLLLFLLAPLLPSFLRVPYFYLLFNVIVLALGVQAGLLRGGGSATSSSATADDDDIQRKSSRDRRHHQAAAPTSIITSPFQRAKSVVVQKPKVVVAYADGHEEICAFGSTSSSDPKKIVKETITMLMKKCPSRASIFFLCALDRGQATSGEQEQEQEQEHEHEARPRALDGEDAVMSRQELFARTESFLGNFRKQLRMQKV